MALLSWVLKISRRLAVLFLLAPLLFLLIFFFYPLGNLIQTSLTGPALVETFGRPATWRTVGFTVGQAGLSTLLTLALGLPAAALFVHFDFRGKALLRALTTVPFVLPTVVVAAAFRALLGSAGPLNRFLMFLGRLEAPPLRLEQSLTIILLAHVFYNLAVVIRLVGPFWANLGSELSGAAQTLGASPRQAFLAVTLPLLRPALIGASLLVFLFTFTSFGVILILGGPAFQTIETEIFRQYVTFLQPGVAAVLSLLQMGFTFGLMLLYGRWQQRAAVPLTLRPAAAAGRRPDSLAGRLGLGLGVLSLSLFLLSPMLALVWRSLVDREGQLTLAYYQALPAARAGRSAFIPPLQAVANSLGYALLTVLSAGSLGLSSAYLLTRVKYGRRWLDASLMLPLGASAVTLGFGYVISFRGLRTAPVLVLIAHSLVALPFVVRSLLPVLQAIPPGWREAAAILGASPGRVWREIDLPIVGRAFLVGAVFAFTVSMGEFGATSFIVRPNSGFLTLPIAIERLLGLPGALNFGQALALSTILMAVCAGGFVLIERLRFAEIGEF